MDCCVPTALYVGPDYPGSNGTCWRDALVELGYRVRTVNTNTYLPEPENISGKVLRRLRGRPPVRAIRSLNEAVVAAYREARPKFSLYVKGSCITAETLKETAVDGPNFAYMNDDMFNPANQDFGFLESLPHFHCIFTTKSFNVREFHRAGAPLAIYLPNAYDPLLHSPTAPQENDKVWVGDVAFIGTFRQDRADFLARLAECRDFKLNIWGGGWQKMRRLDYLHKRHAWRRLVSSIRGPELWGKAMGRAVQSNSICLGLLNHRNRDLHTSRSFEIPACGGFMLAERTEEHRMFFAENREAVYFSSFEELVDKIRFYLAHESARLKIARAGYEKCVRWPNRYVDRARSALSKYETLQQYDLGAPRFKATAS